MPVIPQVTAALAHRSVLSSTPLSKAHFSSDTWGVAGVFGGEEATPAMAAVMFMNTGNGCGCTILLIHTRLPSIMADFSGQNFLVVSSRVFTPATLFEPAEGSPPGDGVLICDKEIVILTGEEDAVNSISRGGTFLQFATRRTIAPDSPGVSLWPNDVRHVLSCNRKITNSLLPNDTKAWRKHEVIVISRTQCVKVFDLTQVDWDNVSFTDGDR
ncbi:hypothetical protein EDC04DRAFT_2888419 [Pisolithus marmoratus]|nr:hypothetical protein EDC04DRAFT_2888419 [Pisolithus marmoratus]